MAHALLSHSARVAAARACASAIPRSLSTCAVFARPSVVDIGSHAHGLLPAVSQRAATSSVSRWLAPDRPGPDAGSLQEVLQYSSEDMARMVVPCGHPDRAELVTDTWRRLAGGRGAGAAATTEHMAFLQGLHADPFTVYHVQQAVSLGTRTRVTVAAPGADGQPGRRLQLSLTPLQETTNGSNVTHMLGELSEV